MNIMTPQGFINTTFKKYINFEGRASRAELYWWHLYVIVISFLLGFILLNILSIKQFETFSTIYGLSLILPNLSLSVRRLHDSGNSGKLIVVAYGLFVIIMILNNLFIIPYLNTIIAFIALVPVFYLYYLTFVKAGDIESNKFGNPDDDYLQ